MYVSLPCSATCEHRHYAIMLKKAANDSKLPRVELDEVGPHMDLDFVRSKQATADVVKEAYVFEDVVRSFRCLTSYRYHGCAVGLLVLFMSYVDMVQCIESRRSRTHLQPRHVEPAYPALPRCLILVPQHADAQAG